MNQQSPIQPRTATRRSFLKTSAALGAAITLPSFTMRSAANKNSAVRMLHIGVGGIGGMQRGQLRNHKKVEFAFLCDVDSNPLNKIGREFPKAQKFSDYREVFEKHLNEFDAVIVDTPDHHHAPMMTRALAAGKHVYGQKPLVHQLDELRMIREALAKRPELYTQMGNQRACYLAECRRWKS